MTRFVVDCGVVLYLVREGIEVPGEHKLFAPTLLRSQTLSALHEAVHEGEIPAEVARERLAHYVDFYARNGRVVRAVAEAAQHDELVQQAHTGLVETFIGVTTNAIRGRIDSGELEPLDAEEVGRALVWMLNGYLADRLGGREQADPARVLETVWTVWTRTLFPVAA
jgi:hypothetical protein